MSAFRLDVEWINVCMYVCAHATSIEVGLYLARLRTCVDGSRKWSVPYRSVGYIGVVCTCDVQNGLLSHYVSQALSDCGRPR